MIAPLIECFDDKVVFKDLKKNNFFKTMKLPSFLRDWVLRRFEDEEGNFDIDEVLNFIEEYMPRKDSWLKIKDNLIIEYKSVKLLTRINVDIDIKTETVSFSLPLFDVTNKETIIEPNVWSLYKNELVNGSDLWGVVEIAYRPPDATSHPPTPGKIRLVSFTNFCPYDVNLDFFKNARSQFSIEEWVDTILGAIDYNSEGYESMNQKLSMLSRLLPFVERNLNILELAPKGTGKSYVFGNLSKYGLLTDGGRVTRAKMFYDSARKSPGFIIGHDFVAVDEVKLVRFGDTDEMRSILQGYMEKGSCNVNGFDIISDAGIVFLGNIAVDNMDEYSNMLVELPPIFKESALVDRIHGFIKGWDIPPMSSDLKVSGWALNTEYFCTILHELRSDITYRAIVDEIVEFNGDSYERHVEAVKRIATAYLKLLFPHIRSANDPDLKKYFENYCLNPAIKMRKIIYKQLSILDEEYKKEEKMLPSFRLRFPNEN